MFFISAAAFTSQTFEEDIGKTIIVVDQDISEFDNQILTSIDAINDIVTKSVSSISVEITGLGLDINNQAFIQNDTPLKFDSSFYIYKEKINSTYRYQKKRYQYHNTTDFI